MIVFHGPAVHCWADKKLAIISGLSNPNCCRLSYEQHAFMEGLNCDRQTKIFLNFPYLDQDSNGQAKSPPQVMPSLLRASLANGMQFLRTQFAGFRDKLQRHWRALTESCQQLSLISISSGLELINACLPATANSCVVRAIAVGPVALRHPTIPCVKIVGYRDWISRCFAGAVDHRVRGVGHLDYLRSSDVKKLVEDWVCSNTFE